ncbi:D-lactate dehydrogenase [Rhizobium miluonense]|uniref:Quinone-dependent D-lactate dehydrogenase n=1 Tax=Rhizobium miluonense TaxID=411945 RepID=A0A1C3V7B0_9HYPH|nr:D-lactate dehydrogenase [Rhizobium miluonense]SCB23585.1 D-lactate dehydrogenase [Rhizobium miluonense]
MKGSISSRSSPKLIDELRRVVGRRQVLISASAMRRHLRGFRYGNGYAVAVARPGSLVEYWRVVETCVKAGAIVISQAANTGLTGGSTPFGSDYDRPVVVVNTMRIKGQHLLGNGRQVVAFPGTTLNELEIALEPLGREPHSVIGSSCLGASVIGGVCNNSGGSLVRRGPSYTEMALYAQLDDDGRLCLVNDLGIVLSGEPEEVLNAIERGRFEEAAVEWTGVGSDHEYRDHVRDIEAETPARYNADVRKLHGASGSAGKLAVFAVRLDTFEAEKDAKVFYVGTNQPEILSDIRRSILGGSGELPIAGEYIHRDAFDIAETYGKDTYLMVKRLGTRRLPYFFEAKSRIDALLERVSFLPHNMTDRMLQWCSSLLPRHLPERLRNCRDRYEHHLMLKVSASAAAATQTLLQKTLAGRDGDFFLCTPKEGNAAFLHRFATAGAAVRYNITRHKKAGGIVALDVALPRNTVEWFEQLPAVTQAKTLKRLYYGHFLCHVFHQDYIVCPSHDWLDVEHELLRLLAARGAKYPAEHNFGHLYAAPTDVVEHYQSLDPCNCFNPGIGQTSRLLKWRGHER